MGKYLILAALVLLTLGSYATLNPAFAGLGFDDPALCIAGQWLIVDAAAPEGVSVTLPEGTLYGDAGGCDPALLPPNVSLFPVSVVLDGVYTKDVRVRVNGSLASTPNITVSYNGKTATKENKGAVLEFKFKLPGS